MHARRPRPAGRRQWALTGAVFVSMCVEAELAVGLRVSATVDHQIQGHEAWPPLLCVHVRAHFGEQFIVYCLIFVCCVYDSAIALAPRFLKRAHPGHAGG